MSLRLVPPRWPPMRPILNTTTPPPPWAAARQATVRRVTPKSWHHDPHFNGHGEHGSRCPSVGPVLATPALGATLQAGQTPRCAVSALRTGRCAVDVAAPHDDPAVRLPCRQLSIVHSLAGDQVVDRRVVVGG